MLINANRKRARFGNKHVQSVTDLENFVNQNVTTKETRNILGRQISFRRFTKEVLNEKLS